MKGLKAFYTRNQITVTYVCLFPLLLLLSGLYAVCVTIAKFLYQKDILPSYKPKAKVISVGNITIGGSGKTPLVEYLASWFIQQGHHVAVLLKGYKRPRHNDGIGSSDYYILGDEGSMLKHNVCGRVTVALAANRAQLAQRLERDQRPDVMILDDGFQHWRLKRDLDIVTVDATSPFGNKFLLPAGHLREGLSSLKRADVFCLTHSEEISEEQLKGLEDFLFRINPQATQVKASHSPQCLYHLRTGKKEELSIINGLSVCLLCGIANPFSFLQSMRQLGAKAVLKKFFCDHHHYSEDEITALVEECREFNVTTVVITEKDAQRLVGLVSKKDLGIDILALKIALKIIYGQEALDGRLHSLYHS